MGGGSTLTGSQIRDALVGAHRTAIGAVAGRASVRRRLQRLTGPPPTHALAVGKAAADMMAGALDVLGDGLQQALVVTKHGHGDVLRDEARRVRVLESSHPVPDASCLAAGEALWRFVEAAPADARFLVMVSGGASALADFLAPGLDAAFLARMNSWLLGAGLSIGPMNRVRKRVSRFKGGRLGVALNGRHALCLLISDVPGDDPKVVGSGPLTLHEPEDIQVADLTLPDWLAQAAATPPALANPQALAAVHTEVVAHPALARDAAAADLRGRGLIVREHQELLEGDATRTGRDVVNAAVEEPGMVHLWSSETTVMLPQAPGRGGRCQTLALSAALALEDAGVGVVLAAGTDGTDGPGEDAGAVVDAGTASRGRDAGRDPDAHIAAADAGSFLDESGDLLRTGPTGTNVMDLLMAWMPGRA